MLLFSNKNIAYGKYVANCITDILSPENTSISDTSLFFFLLKLYFQFAESKIGLWGQVYDVEKAGVILCACISLSLSLSLSPCVCVTDAIVACNLNSQKHTEQLTKMAQKNVFGNAHYIIISRLCCTHVTHGCHLYNWNLRFQQQQQKKEYLRQSGPNII